MRWSFFRIVLGIVVGSAICVLAAYGVAILTLYAVLQAVRL